MKLWLAQVVLQLFLALGLSPFVSGFIRKLKAVLQNRRGPSLWQPYHDLFKWVRKGTVVSQQASWLFRATPYVSFLTALMVSLMVPMVTAVVPLSYFGGVLAVVYLLALARFFVALAALDTASAFGGMGSSREMTVSALAEPAMMLSIFTVALTAGSTNLSFMVQAALQHQERFLSPSHILALAAMFIVLIAETGRLPVEQSGHAPGIDDDPRSDDPRILRALFSLGGMGDCPEAVSSDEPAGQHFLSGGNRRRSHRSHCDGRADCLCCEAPASGLRGGTG